MNCRKCDYCEMIGRANSLYAGSSLYGRGRFFCKNPETAKMPLSAFGNKMPGFIGFGTPERDTKLQIKTHPRWCPLKEDRNDR